VTRAGVTWHVASGYNKRHPPGQDLQARLARSGVGQKLQARASTARERLHSAADSARQRFSRSSSSEEFGDYDTAYDTSAYDTSYGEPSKSSRFSSTLHSARDKAGLRARQAQDRLYTMLEEQPLVLGALAVEVGALLGTLMTSTHYVYRVDAQTVVPALTTSLHLGEHQYEQLSELFESQNPRASGSGVASRSGRAWLEVG